MNRGGKVTDWQYSCLHGVLGKAQGWMEQVFAVLEHVRTLQPIEEFSHVCPRPVQPVMEQGLRQKDAHDAGFSVVHDLPPSVSVSVSVSVSIYSVIHSLFSHR